MYTIEIYLERDIVGVDDPIGTFKSDSIPEVGKVYRFNEGSYFEILDVVSTTHFEADSALIIEWVSDPRSKAYGV